MRTRAFAVILVMMAVSRSSFSTAQEAGLLLPASQTRFGILERVDTAKKIPFPRPSGCNIPEVRLIESIAENPKKFNLLKATDIDKLMEARSLLFAKVGRKMERVATIEKELWTKKIAEAGGERNLLSTGEGIAQSLNSDPEVIRIIAECDVLRSEFRAAIASIFKERSASEDVVVKYIQSTVVGELGPAWTVNIFVEHGAWKLLFPKMEDDRRNLAYKACQRFLDKCDENFVFDFQSGVDLAFEKLPERRKLLLPLSEVLKRSITFDSRQGAASRQPRGCEIWLRKYESKDDAIRTDACIDRSWVEIVATVKQRYPELANSREATFKKVKNGKSSATDLLAEVDKSFELQATALKTELSRDAHPMFDSAVTEVIQDGSLEAVIRHPVMRKVFGLSDDQVASLSASLADSDKVVREEWKSYTLQGSISALSEILTADELRVFKSIADGSAGPMFITRLKMQ